MPGVMAMIVAARSARKTTDVDARRCRVVSVKVMLTTMFIEGIQERAEYGYILFNHSLYAVENAFWSAKMNAASGRWGSHRDEAAEK